MPQPELGVTVADYEVKWLRGDRVLSMRSFTTIEEASRDAEQLLPHYVRLFDATAVEVRDRNGSCHLIINADKTS
jgi:hypothetical protein